MILILLNLLLEVVDGDLVVLNNAVDLELLDTESDGNEGVSTPGKTLCKTLADIH